MLFSQAGEKLGKYEVEKRQAVETEDYDRAQMKKVQIDEYRLQVYTQLQIPSLMEVTGGGGMACDKILKENTVFYI